MRDLNDDEAAPLLRFCLDHGYELRFIEQMPLDAQHGWKRAEMVTAQEILAALGRGFTLTPDDPQQRGSAPAEAFLVDGGPARVGVIASVTRPFCGTCDRVRLTADGQVRNCLFARSESDLRGLLRAGAGDAELAGAWQRAVAVKLPGHGINDPSFLQPDRPMSAIGG
jgi:cyclic pyranopterin phosphate synthase